MRAKYGEKVLGELHLCLLYFGGYKGEKPGDIPSDGNMKREQATTTSRFGRGRQ